MRVVPSRVRENSPGIRRRRSATPAFWVRTEAVSSVPGGPWPRGVFHQDAQFRRTTVTRNKRGQGHDHIGPPRQRHQAGRRIGAHGLHVGRRDTPHRGVEPGHPGGRRAAFPHRGDLGQIGAGRGPQPDSRGIGSQPGNIRRGGFHSRNYRAAVRRSLAGIRPHQRVLANDLQKWRLRPPVAGCRPVPLVASAPAVSRFLPCHDGPRSGRPGSCLVAPPESRLHDHGTWSAIFTDRVP